MTNDPLGPQPDDPLHPKEKRPASRAKPQGDQTSAERDQTSAERDKPLTVDEKLDYLAKTLNVTRTELASVGTRAANADVKTTLLLVIVILMMIIGGCEMIANLPR